MSKWMGRKERIASIPQSYRLGPWLEAATMLRLIVACLVQWYVQKRGRLCLFPDTEVYWRLAQTIVHGTPYEISQWGIPHLALRTPGYPLFLAAFQAIFGDRVMPVRIAQAILGAASVWLTVGLVKALDLDRLQKGFRQDERRTNSEAERSAQPRFHRLPPIWWIAAGIAALEPYHASLSVLILSEALFAPLSLAALWGTAVVWRGDDRVRWRSFAGLAFGIGIAHGALILVRPSWALFVPLSLIAWLLIYGKTISQYWKRPLAGSILIVLGVIVVMAPWWVRNERAFGRFVPTAIWAGASLYDGLNPKADGSSNMDFLNDPDVWPLDEIDQDSELTRRAFAFATGSPRRVVELAIAKAGRYFSPWPNAEVASSAWVKIAGAIVTVPLYLLILYGAWDRRRDPRALFLTLGPILYFAIIHMIFVGSVRYRVAAEAPSFVLAAIGFDKLFRRFSGGSERSIEFRGGDAGVGGSNR